MRYRAEVFDNLQYLYTKTGFNDHQLHCVINFDSKVDASILEKAVYQLIKTVPILSRIYRNKEGSSYWEDSNITKKGDLFMVVKSEKDFERFIVSKTNEETGPQIKVCLLQSEKDSLSIVMNHMIADGAGFKQCIYLLSHIYSKLMINQEYVPNYIVDGNRSFKRVISEISLVKKVKALLFNRKDNNQSSNYTFPMSSDGNTSPFILTYSILPDRYNRLKDYCNETHATVNDVLLAAYIRALSKTLNINRKYLRIPLMVDMRRYIKEKSFKALTNLTSITTLKIRILQNEGFYDTLIRVSSSMKMKKSNSIGLNTFLKLDILYKLFKRNIGYKLLHIFLENPNICMTNIGVLDSTKLSFLNSTIHNAYLCGSIKYRPHFQLAVSTYKDRMTWCINLYGNEEDRKNVEKFYDLIDKELAAVQI